jgi:hypothetical protein
VVAHTRITKYINEEPELNEEQKQSLILLACKHSNRQSSIMGWISALNFFKRDDFVDRSLFEKGETVRTLIRSLNNSTLNRIFSDLTEILFGDFPSFLQLILDRCRRDSNRKAKALMVELFLRFSEDPVTGATPDDYLAGFHHKDELVRCKTLHFLYSHYGERVLLPMVSEVFKVDRPLSILFCRTLCHFVQLHPQIRWVEEVEKIEGADGMMEKGTNGRDPRWIIFQEMQGSLNRHHFLILNGTEESPQQDCIRDKQGTSANPAPKKDSTGIRLERFAKINSSVKGA